MSVDKKPLDEDHKLKEEMQRKIRILHKLAVRLPWIVVIIIIFVAIITIIEAFLGKG